MTAHGGARLAAAIDVGSNSVLLLVVAVGPDGRARAVDEAVRTTRLGAGLRPGGPLDPDAVRRTRDGVVAFAERARRAGAEAVWAFATGAARRAADGARFVAELARASACPVEILSGEREAALAYAAVVHGLDLGARPALVVDTGGATTELTLGQGTTVLASASVALGALALTEACGDDTARMEAEVARALATIDLPARARAAGAVLVASAGTATSLAALALGLARYDPRRVHGVTLAAGGLAALAVRAARPIDAGRAAILPAGACIIAGVMTAAGAGEMTVSDHGVRHAYLREHLGRLGVAADMRTLWD